MRRMLLAPVIVAAALSLLAQTTASSNDKRGEDSPAPCTVSGRVVTAADGTALQSAHVALKREHSWLHPDVYATTSDSNGQFILRNVKPGRYLFFATRSGYVEQQYESKGTGTGAVLALKSGQELTEVLFRLVMAAVVTGRVNDENGEPMTGAQVVALRKLSAEESDEFFRQKSELVAVASARTDDRGLYRIFGLQPGEYYLRATDPLDPPRDAPVGDEFWVREWLGTEYPQVYYPGVLRPDQAQMILLHAGDEIQADFSMRRAKTVEIAGRVIAPDGGAAARASVSLDQPGAEDFGLAISDQTDEKGRFSLKGVFPGTYTIVAFQREGDEKEYRAHQKIEVGNEKIDSIILMLGGGADIRGRVTVDGPGPVGLDQIVLSLGPVPAGEDLGAWCHAKKDGSFEFMDMEDGTYSLGLAGLERGWYAKSVRIGSGDVLTQGVQVEKGTTGGNLEVVISSASAQLDGFVTDHDGAVMGAHVRVTADPETPYNRTRSETANTDQTGHFLLDGVAPGKYRVIASLPTTSKGTPVSISDPQTVTLSEHDHKTVQLKIVPPEKE